LTRFEKAMKPPASSYLLYGEEGYAARQFAKNLIEKILPIEEQSMNLTIFEEDPTPGELVNLLTSMPFFGEKRVVMIGSSRWFQSYRRKGGGEASEDLEIEEVKEPKDNADASIVKIISDMPSFSHLILLTQKADKRRKLFKVITEFGQTIEFAPFKPGFDDREIRAWITEHLAKEGRQLSRDAMEYLLGVIAVMSQVSQGFLASELDKAILYAGKITTITRKDLEQVLSAVPEVSAFAMTEAIGRKNAAQALARLADLFADREPELKIIGLITYHVRQWWQAKQILVRGGQEKEIGELLHQKYPFVLQRIIAQSRLFKEPVLKRGMLTLAEASQAARSGGDARMLLERVVIELCHD